MQYEENNSFNLSRLFGVIFSNLHADFVTLNPSHIFFHFFLKQQFKGLKLKQLTRGITWRGLGSPQGKLSDHFAQ